MLCPKATEGTVSTNCLLSLFFDKLNINARSESATSFPFNVNDPVEAQAYDNINSRLALASHSGTLRVFKLCRSKMYID